jgi:hypothetical protein
MCKSQSISFTIPVGDANVLRAMINMLEEVMSGIPKRNAFGLVKEAAYGPDYEDTFGPEVGASFVKAVLGGGAPGNEEVDEETGEMIGAGIINSDVPSISNVVLGQSQGSNILQSPPIPFPLPEVVRSQMSQPSPVPTAPLVPAAPPAANTSPVVELDIRGLPWDQRIHSSSHNKCKTGEWKNARGADPVLVKQVEEELRAAMAAPGPGMSEILSEAFKDAVQMGGTGYMVVEQIMPAPPVIEVPAPPVPPFTINSPRLTIEPSPTSTPAPPFVPDVTCSPDTSAAGPTPTMTFAQFLPIVTKKCAEKVITYQEVTKICQNHGVQSLSLLNTARPDLIAAVHAELEALCPTKPTAG